MSDRDNCSSGGRRCRCRCRSPTPIEYGVIIGVIYVVVVIFLVEITKWFARDNLGTRKSANSTKTSRTNKLYFNNYFFLVPTVGLPFLAVVIGGLVKLKRLHASGYFSNRKAKNSLMANRGSSVMSVSTVVASSSNTGQVTSPAQ